MHFYHTLTTSTSFREHVPPKMRTWIVFLLFEFTIEKTLGSFSKIDRISCDWTSEFLCGDKCVAIKGGKCFCGDDKLSIADAFEVFCCNPKSCQSHLETPGNDTNLNVYCENGKVQSMYSHCNDACKQTSVYGMGTFSCHDERCYLGTFACRGTRNCEDYSDLAQCTQKIDCEEQTDGVFQSCGDVPGAKYQNYACKHRASSTFEYFECLNRLDKIETLFQRPIIIAKKKRESVNYNTNLHYDGDFVQCGSRNISFDQFPYVIGQNLQEPCQLKNGQSVTLEALYDLLTQFSFEQSIELMKYHSEESQRKLSLQCFESDQHPFICNPNSTTGQHHLCAYGHQVCDTIANCPDGSDEAFDMCQDYFSELATIVCDKKDNFHVNITIKAVACDGITECADGRDEVGCSEVLPDEDIYIIFSSVFLTIIAITLILWFDTKGSLKLKLPGEMLTDKEFREMHGSIAMQERVSHWQGLAKQKVFNQAFYNLELKRHEFNLSSTICCMKNSLDMKTFSNVMKDKPSKKKKSIPKKIIKFLSKYSGLDLLLKGLKRLTLLQMILSATSYVMDITKDVLIVSQISLALGGFKKTFLNYEECMSGIVFIWIGTIFIPLLLSNLQLMSQGPQFGRRRTTLVWMIWICVQPVYPVIVILKEKMLHHMSKVYEVSASQYANAKEQMTKYVQAELGLETIYQTFLQLLLVLLAKSDTRTIQGLEMVFADDGTEEILGMNPTFIFAYSTTWSIFSCIRSFMKGRNIKREYSTWESTLANFLFACLSITIRIASFLLYFTPCLGLGNIHRFYQGEMYPFLAPMAFDNSLTNLDGEYMHFGNAPPILWSKITRWNYTLDSRNPIPPPKELYNWFSIKQYTGVFIVMLFVHPFLVMLGKWLANPRPFSRLHWLDCVIHCACNTNVPFPMEDWDERKGQVASHKRRQKLVLRETLTVIIINFVIHFFLLIPLILLSVSIFERKSILESSIGVLPKEMEAFRKIQLLLGLGYGGLMLLTLGQVIVFYFYNGSWHPLSKIISNPKKVAIQMEEMVPLDG